MLLIKCKECGKEISDKARFCPKCGAENKFTFCPDCNNKVSRNALSCPSCGCVINNKNNSVSNGNHNAKSKIAAGLLAIFLGTLGVHNFYLGYTGKAVIQLLLTILTCGVGAIITSIWSIIEGILIFAGSISADANGVKLKD